MCAIRLYTDRCRSRQDEFARLNLNYTLASKQNWRNSLNRSMLTAGMTRAGVRPSVHCSSFTLSPKTTEPAHRSGRVPSIFKALPIDARRIRTHPKAVSRCRHHRRGENGQHRGQHYQQEATRALHRLQWRNCSNRADSDHRRCRQQRLMADQERRCCSDSGQRTRWSGTQHGHQHKGRSVLLAHGSSSSPYA